MTEGGKKIIAQNKKARYDYHIVENFEAGLVLTGAEIKSIKAGHIELTGSYVRPIGDELFLISCQIKPYSHMTDPEYNPTRDRKLLLNRHEIDKLRSRVEKKGLTIVPLSVYLKDGRAKLEIALAQGKAAPDKRASIKDRELKRKAAQVMKHRQ